MSRSRAALAAAALLSGTLQPGTAAAADFDTLNDLGGVGLLQTPSARFSDVGTFGVGISHIKPYNQIQLFATPTPWLETTFRYTDVTDRAFGPVEFSGNQSYKDRSFGFKLRLIEESERGPAVAIGVQDFGGTGVLGGEYIVASRRYYDFDLSFGLGWGRLGAGGDLRNPLGRLIGRFDTRGAAADGSNTPGGSGVSRLFRGKLGPFGGIQWRTPVPYLNLKLEYDGNDYSSERGNGTRIRQSLPINVGLDYAVSDSFSVGVGFERGERASFHLALRTSLEGSGPRKTLDPPPPPPRVRAPESIGQPAPDAISEADGDALVLAAETALRQQGFEIAAVKLSPDRRGLSLWIEQNSYRSPLVVLGRTARALNTVMPAWVDHYTVIGVDAGVEVWRLHVLRKDFEAMAQYRGSPEETRRHADSDPPLPDDPAAQGADHPDRLRLPRFNWDTGPGFRQQIGGPDGFYFGQILWRLTADVRLTQGLTVSGGLAFNIVNNFNNITLASDSQLPRVRSDIVQYLQNGQQAVTKLETNYIWSPASTVYARVSAGIFEEMYGGIGAEVLWRPQFQRWAIGANVNVVQQREFAERFNFRDYRVATGNLNLYYEFPWYGLKAKVSGGRYLAKDYGSTIELTREFKSGASLGVFATFTNVPARVFGEGSFDKGFFINIPFDLLFAKSTRRSASFLFRPLTRDGGQKVRDGIDLYNATDAGNPGRIVGDWADVTR